MTAAPDTFETVVGQGFSSLIALTTGELLLVEDDLRARRSPDGGRTWSCATPLLDPDGRPLQGGSDPVGVLTLASGGLALTYGRTESGGGPHGDFGLCLRHSEDEGRTWGHEIRINRAGAFASNYHNALIQLRAGRLVLPVRWCFAVRHADRGGRTHAWGRLGGCRFAVEGHGHTPEADIAFVYCSDDEGQSWKRSQGELMGWFNDGYDGVTPVDEPVVAELRDGSLLLLARSTVGRLVRSHSADGGETWSSVEPTDLASSYSPWRLARIPSTGDLLLIWNQVSGEEIRRGHRRGRLSLAISRDGGATWGHFQTIALSAGLEDRAQVRPDPEVRMVRARDDVGDLPDSFATYSYPNVTFAGERAFILYSAGLFEPRDAAVHQARERRLRVLPVDQLYAGS